MIVNAKRVNKKPPASDRSGRHRPAPGFARVVRRPGERHRGLLLWRGRAIPVAIGRSGIRAGKREGDGATPAGVWHAVAVRWRADHGHRPVAALPARRTRADDGWCDDPADRRYNRAVTLPFPASHERMWRPDGLYDLVVVLDHNTRPRKARGGSAVFLHIARAGFGPTEGCVAFRPADLRRLLREIGPRTPIRFG